MKQSLPSKILFSLAALISSCIFLFPLYWTFVTSLKSYREAFAQPPTFFVIPPTIANYVKFLGQSDILLYLRNSVTVVIFALVIPMIVGVLASYALTRSHVWGKEGFGLFMLATRFVPPISTLIPIYIIFRQFHLYDTLAGLILLNCGMNIPYVIWMMRGFIKDVPESIEESAWVDGCSRLYGFVRIVIPMCRSGIAATGVLIMVFSWNEYLYSMMLTGVKAKTLPLAMMTYMGEQGIEWHMMAAAGIVILLPTILFSILTHRNLGSGLSFGAVKG